MKSTMKSTFAIIAVVLMVLVAVVPMVGVFTETSDAVVVTDPASANDAENKITVNVKMYGYEGTVDTTAAGKIKITHGAYSQEKTPVDGAATFTIYESSVPTLRICYLNTAGTEDANYPAVTLNSLVGGQTYNASLQAGLKSQMIKFEFKNSTALFKDYVTSLSGSYKAYASDEEGAAVVKEGQLTINSDFTATFQFPTSVTTTVYVVLTISTNPTLSCPTDKIAITIAPATAQVVKVEQSLVSATVAGLEGTVTVSSYKLYNTVAEVEGQPITFTTIPGKNTLNAGAYFVGKVPTEGTNTYTLSLTADTTNFTTEKVAYNDSITSVVFGNVLRGNIHMDSVNYTQKGTLTATLLDGESASKGTVSAKVDDNGNFFKFVTTADIATFKAAATFSLEDGTQFDVTISTGLTAVQNVNISSVTAGYSQVSGTLYLGNSEKVVAGKELTINGTNVKKFGSVVTKGSGMYDFMAETGKNIIIAAANATLSGTTSVVPGQDSTGKSIYMNTQDVLVIVTDALGDELIGVTATLVDSNNAPVVTTGTAGQLIDNGDGTYSATVRADIAPTQYFVYFSKDGYTFAAANADTKVAYAAGKTYTANEGTFSISFFTADLEPIVPVANAIKVAKTSVYKNSVGAFIYDTGTAVAATISGNAYQITVPLDLIKKSASSVTTAPTTVITLEKGEVATLWTNYILETIYLLTADAAGDVTIVAGMDYLEAKLTRLDGETPLAGALVKIGNDLADPDATTYTQSDGSFRFVSAKQYTTEKIGFELANYDFADDLTVLVDEEKVTAFTSEKDYYEITFVDADDEKIELAGDVGLTGATVISREGNVEKIKAGWTYETDSIEITSGMPALRSFTAHYLNDVELSTGKVTMVSNQSTYTFQVVDNNYKAIPGVTISLKKYVGDQPIADGDLTATDAKGKTTVLLPKAADELDTEYGFVANDLGDYIFDSDVVEITDVAILVESISAEITFKLKDASGADIVAGAVFGVNSAKIYKDGSKTAITKTPVNGKITFVNDPEGSYTVSVDSTTGVIYTFPAKQTPVNSVVYAYEEWIVGDVMDAVGNSIGIEDVTVITATATYGDDVVEHEATYGLEDFGNCYMILADKDAAVFTTAVANYTFEESYSPNLYANEQKVAFSAVSANGVEFSTVGAEHVTIANAAAYDENGIKISKGAFADYVIVDVDDVAYFKADVTYTENKYTFDKESLLPVFVANESLITGTVPYTGGTAAGAIRLDLYLGDNLVKSINGKIADDKYNYTAILDLSDFVVDGVAFDSIIAVYSEGGVVIGTGIVDPFTQVNNIISPTVEIYFAELLPPSALIANHVAIEQIGVMVTVTADSNFMIADDEGVYTDGQYTYTFAGWYVDNQKVSTSPVFTFELTDDVVISPQYTVTYEKTSDANDKQTPQPQPVQPDNSIDTNVLIIGICAVIVALIAVVYAVIKKE